MTDWVDNFNKFLRVRNLFITFYDNVNESVLLHRLNKEHFLFLSFSWEDSPEGHSFWADVNEEWLESIEEEGV